MPVIVPRKKAVVTQPYQARPPRSASISGITVTTASDSKATSVTIATSPSVNARYAGSNNPTADELAEAVSTFCICGKSSASSALEVKWPDTSAGRGLGHCVTRMGESASTPQ